MLIINSTCEKLKDDESLTPLNPIVGQDVPAIGDLVNHIWNTLNSNLDLKDRIRLKYKLMP
jgi:hypothetical protein